MRVSRRRDNSVHEKQAHFRGPVGMEESASSRTTSLLRSLVDLTSSSRWDRGSSSPECILTGFCCSDGELISLASKSKL